MELLVIGAIAWFIMKHHSPAIGATAAGNLGNPTGPMVPLGPAPSTGGGGAIAPNGNPGIIPPGMATGDVVGSNANPYGTGFGNTVGQTTRYPAGTIQNWIPLNRGATGPAVAGSGLPGAGGSPADLGGDMPPQMGLNNQAGYVIGRGY